MNWLLRRRVLLGLAALTLVAACGGDDDSSATEDTTGGGDSASDGQPVEGPPSEDVEAWQTDLNAVGCYAGPVDGALGSQTQAAIEAFQAAKGLEVDGVLGPQTEEALQDAVAGGETVCSSAGDEGSGDEATAALSSSGYGPVEFVIGSCSSSGESDIELQAEVNNMTLLVDASEADRTEEAGAGSLSVDGGTEADGITLNGRVESVTVGDAGDFTVTGVFEAPNNEGEEFTLTGSCA